MPQELGQIEAASTVHEYKRKAKNEQPTDNMDTHFQKNVVVKITVSYRQR